MLDARGRTLLLPLLIGVCIYIFYLYVANRYTFHPVFIIRKQHSITSVNRVMSKAHLDGECHIPDLNPFDPVVMKLKKRYRRLHCKKQPDLSFIDDHGNLHINDTAVELLKRKGKNVSCVYYPITRHELLDDSIRVWKNRTLEQGVPVKLDVELVKVVCLDDNKTVIYHETLTYVRDLSEDLRRRNSKLVKEGRASIMMIGFDSTSRLNFMRQLPKTYSFLTDTLNSTVLKGHTKSAENTKPNFFAFLSGVTLAKNRSDVPGPFMYRPKDWSGRDNHKPAPVWWKTVREQGYISMTIDDSAGHATYHIQPTDYYAMPYYYALDLGDMAKEDIVDRKVPNIHEAKYMMDDKYKCKGNTPVHELHFRYVENFARKLRGQVYFALSFLVRYSHGDLNSIQLVDDYLAAMLERMRSSGDLDNTVLMIFSDHGLRFGNILKSPFGNVELNMPMMSVYLPPKLRASKPHLQSGLESNSERLLSWFDMHELVMDLVMDNLEPESRVTRWKYNGLSPFRDIPRNRTCYDAGIPPEYCVCVRPTAVKVTDNSVKDAAQKLLENINDMLSPKHPECAKLKLRSVESAELISLKVDPVKKLRVSFLVDPSGAHFQGIVERRQKGDNGTVIGHVERINAYGHQSHCIKREEESELKLYCFCHKSK